MAVCARFQNLVMPVVAKIDILLDRKYWFNSQTGSLKRNPRVHEISTAKIYGGHGKTMPVH